MYSLLSKWHAKYGDKVEILLYPSDEFGGQELPSAEVPGFVKSQGLPTDGGGCTLMDKVKVNGGNADPLWTLVKKKFPGDVGWNFAGIFTFDAHGEVTGRFDANQLPQVSAHLEKLVAEAKQEL